MSSSESRPPDGLPPEYDEVWRALLAVATRGLERIDQQLQKRSSMTLTDYEIMSALSRAEDDRLRMSELAEQVYVSRSRLTYRVDRLAEVGFVVREECQDDRRGLWAILTSAGRETVKSATDGHHRDLHQLFFDHLTEDEIPILASVLATIVEKLDID
ncbi:MAG: MarR family transcriptional regulator [Acidimicrobiia bacterium]|nr:MarR family transcriptional regulator [Acidimicrobiia bacterium]